MVCESDRSHSGVLARGEENFPLERVLPPTTPFMMSLPTLPAELLLLIARALLYCATCHCHHLTAHLSALARSNHRLHALLGPYLHQNSSPLHILLWAIAHTRHDTLALALTLGADPTTQLHQLGGTGITHNIQTGTPVDIAISMRRTSQTALSHNRKLTTISLLLAAGGSVSVYGLISPTRDGDIDVLALCLPHLPDVNARRACAKRRTLLENAALCGHVRVMGMLIRAGAAVNSSAAAGSGGFFPPLWECWNAPREAIQVLLEAGADPKWTAPDGESVVQHVRRLTSIERVAAGMVELLVRYGAVVDGPVARVNVSVSRGPWESEYTGWMLGRGGRRDWVRDWVEAREWEGCGCPVCPLSATGGVVGVRRMNS